MITAAHRALLGACLASLALFFAPPASAEQELPIDLAVAVRAFDTAQIDADRASLERLVADDYVLIGGDGVVQNKAQFIADFTSPNFHIQPFTVEEPVARVYGETAIIAGRVALSGESGGAAFTVHVRFSDVWVRRNGAWQVAFAQVTRLPNE